VLAVSPSSPASFPAVDFVCAVYAAFDSADGCNENAMPPFSRCLVLALFLERMVVVLSGMRFGRVSEDGLQQHVEQTQASSLCFPPLVFLSLFPLLRLLPLFALPSSSSFPVVAWIPGWNKIVSHSVASLATV